MTEIDLPDVIIMDMAKNYYRIERSRKYLGCIRFDEPTQSYSAWHEGVCLGETRSLVDAAHLFKAVK